EPAAEADGEGFRIEQGPRAHEVQGLLPLIRPAPPRLLPDAPHQVGLELVVHRPHGRAVQLEHLVPEPGVVHAGKPIRAEMRVEQGQDAVRHPRGDMDAVRDMADRHTRDLAAWPERGPDAACFFAMAARYRVDPRRQPDGCDRHWKAVVVHPRMRPEPRDRFAGHPHLLPYRADALLHLLQRKRVVPGGHRRVGREDTRRTYPAYGVRERGAAGHELANPLDQH